MPPDASAEVLEALTGSQWATPLKKLKVAVSKIGDRGWYQVAEDLYISAVSHDPRSGNYLEDPKGPFVTRVVWTACPEAISVLMGDANTVNRGSGRNPPVTFLPSGARGSFRSIVEGLGAGNYWDRSVYTGDDKFMYRMIADAEEAYTYYFSGESIDDDELPFAVVYPLENGRSKS
jgi:hypothetical protein